ncbi:MAG: hypothetical protein MI741_06835, partial [Rhodospirillales bacterium]|nr:hypothetical protein [Rhodospirillales bacterium]
MKFLQPLFLLMARCTHNALARQVQYLKVENEILRSKLPKRTQLTPEERCRLVKYGEPVGSGITYLISIVHPKTFARWLREAKGHVPRSRGTGRPRTAEQVVELIRRIAKETGWGYTRIKGELIKLGHPKVGRTTIQNTLKRDGYDPTPGGSGPQTWDAFIARHAKTLWAADFLSVKSWTHKGLKQMYLLAFIQIETRKVWVSPCTLHPNREWMAQQARNFLMHVDDAGLKAGQLIRDRDGKYAPVFDAILESSGIDVIPLSVRSPNLNAY